MDSRICWILHSILSTSAGQTLTINKDVFICVQFGVLNSHYLNIKEQWEKATLRKLTSPRELHAESSQKEQRCDSKPEPRCDVTLLTAEPLCGPWEISLTTDAFWLALTLELDGRAILDLPLLPGWAGAL